MFIVPHTYFVFSCGIQLLKVMCEGKEYLDFFFINALQNILLKRAFIINIVILN